MFANINTHSYYSMLSSNLSIKNIINFAIDNKQNYVFLTDDNLYGSIEFINECYKNNLKPIVGLEVNYNNNNLLLFPQNSNGYKNIIKISSFLMQTKNFAINDFLEDVIVIFKSKINDAIKAQHIFTFDQSYQNRIAANEARYYTNTDSIVYHAMQAIKNDNKLDFNNLVKINYELLPCDKILLMFDKLAIENTKKMIGLIKWDFIQKTTEIINYPLKTNISARAFLKQLTHEKLKSKLGFEILPSVYEQRLNYELDIIDEMGFNNYFLIVWDFVKFAHDNDILIGPGRGSAAGSLVSFALSITMIDPVKNNLIFERFLNPNRKSKPDIDIDIADNRRQEIIDYIFNKYGYDNVAHIITFQRIKAKMAIRDVGRILSIELPIINKITKLIAPEFDNDLLSAVAHNNELSGFYNVYPELFNIANKLIDCPRQTGTHAAGIVLSSEPLINVIPIQEGINFATTTQISMEFLEPLGLIKIDLLGLSNLTIIANIIKVLKMRKINIDLYNIPLNDKKIYEQISQGNTNGIFQLESPGMKKTLRLIQPSCLEDISIVSALFRPGPQDNIKKYAQYKNQHMRVEYIDNRLEKILKPTYGIIIYQEQVIDIVTTVANFSPADADIFRKAISKKNDKEIEDQKSKFFQQALKNNYDLPTIEKIFCYIEKFAAYGFNHSHSLSYALISYWMMYFKVYFKIEFYSVLLSMCEGIHEKIYTYTQEARKVGIEIMQPAINISKKNFSIFNNKIYFGFAVIKGIGKETSKKIINIRNQLVNKKFTSYTDAVVKLYTNGVWESVIQILIKAGAFDEFNLTRKYMLANLCEIIKVSKNIKLDGTFLHQPQLINVNYDQQDQKDEYYEQEKLLGINFDFNLKNNFDLSKYKHYQIEKLAAIEEINKIYTVAIKILSINEKTTKNNCLMAFIKVSDDSLTTSLVCFNYENLKPKLIINTYVIATIKKDSRSMQLISIKEVINE